MICEICLYWWLRRVTEKRNRLIRRIIGPWRRKK